MAEKAYEGVVGKTVGEETTQVRLPCVNSFSIQPVRSFTLAFAGKVRQLFGLPAHTNEEAPTCKSQCNLEPIPLVPSLANVDVSHGKPVVTSNSMKVNVVEVFHRGKRQRKPSRGAQEAAEFSDRDYDGRTTDSNDIHMKLLS